MTTFLLSYCRRVPGGGVNKVLYKVLPLYRFSLSLHMISIIANLFKRLLTSNFKMEESGFFKENKETVNEQKYFYCSNKVHTIKSGIHIKVARIVAFHE